MSDGLKSTKMKETLHDSNMFAKMRETQPSEITQLNVVQL